MVKEIGQNTEPNNTTFLINCVFSKEFMNQFKTQTTADFQMVSIFGIIKE